MPYHEARANACYSNAVLSGLAGHTFDLRIAGTSRKALVDQQFSFVITGATGTGASTMTFTLNPGASPQFGQDVVVTLGEDLFWGGTVTDVTDVVSGQLVRNAVECVDWRWRMDAGTRITRRLVDVACNTAVATIVHEHTDPADGFRLGFVSPSLGRVTVELEDATVTEALQAIADAAGASILRVRPTKRVDVYSAGFPSGASLALTNTSRGLHGSLSRRTESGQVRTRTRVVGRAAVVVGAVAAGGTVITVDAPALFRPTSGAARVATEAGPLNVTYTSITGDALVGVTGLTAPVEDGAAVAPMEVSDDAAAQTALAASLGRAAGVVEAVLRVDGDWLACAAAATTDVQQNKVPAVSINWIEDGPLARFFAPGEPVTVTLTAPVSEGPSTFTVHSVKLTPGDIMASDNPRFLAEVGVRTARRADLVDVFAIRATR
jgi:hypothetical protein